MKKFWLDSSILFMLFSGIFALVQEKTVQQNAKMQFKVEYIQDVNFAKGFSFKDVTDIAVNPVLKHVFVLQRAIPFVTVWSQSNDTLLFSWKTTEIGYPHSITLKGTNPSTASVWITDMAGPVTSVTNSYGHCVRKFTYAGEYIRSIGSCGKNTNGSSVDPIQFDKVTDIAWSPITERYYIADGDLGGLNNRIIVMNSEFHVVDVWNANNRPSSGPGEFSLPHAIKIDVCNRVWITDAQNHRVQIFSGKGEYYSELSCFGNTLVYGMDFLLTNYNTVTSNTSLLVTTKSVSDSHAEVVCVPVKMDCLDPKDIGICEIERRFVLSQSVIETSNSFKENPVSMLHSVTVDALSGDIYLSQLPGSTPPLKFYPAPHPPVGNISGQAYCSSVPPPWPMEWNATVLLTPYTDIPLITAQMIYSAQSQAMFVQTSGPNPKNTQGTLTIEDRIYTIDLASNYAKCVGPIDIGKSWSTPTPRWLSDRNCKCYGAKETGGIESVLWKCPNENEKFIDWFWFDAATKRPWRMFFNANTSKIPVLGDYTMISFSSYGSGTQLLQNLIKACTNGENGLLPKFHSLNYTQPLNFVSGFSYNGCEGIQRTSILQDWPKQFYLTVTMLPVNDYDPMPTSVIYDWTRESQHTIMYAINSTTSAYLIRNTSYITERSGFNNNVSCLSHLNFGPPHPDWMIMDQCKCMGIISNNRVLSPWPTTAVIVCPLQNDRVFWTWFAINDYYPVIFFETLSPPQEGTNLAYADYHQFYPNNMLVDLQDFVPPDQCIN